MSIPIQTPISGITATLSATDSHSGYVAANSHDIDQMIFIKDMQPPQEFELMGGLFSRFSTRDCL